MNAPHAACATEFRKFHPNFRTDETSVDPSFSTVPWIVSSTINRYCASLVASFVATNVDFCVVAEASNLLYYFPFTFHSNLDLCHCCYSQLRSLEPPGTTLDESHQHPPTLGIPHRPRRRAL